MQQKKFSKYLIGGVILLLVIIWGVTTNNSLIKKREKVNLQWSEVQNTYQRRIDLIPNLVNVVKGVSDFEQSALENIAIARANAIKGMTNDEVNSENYNSQKKIQDNLAGAANRIIINIEKYPTLKGTAAYSGLQTQLEGTERRIKVARNDFNESVAEYNKKVRSFPSNIIANLLGFKKKEGFEADAGSDKAIEIKFK